MDGVPYPQPLIGHQPQHVLWGVLLVNPIAHPPRPVPPRAGDQRSRAYPTLLRVLRWGRCGHRGGGGGANSRGRVPRLRLLWATFAPSPPPPLRRLPSLRPLPLCTPGSRHPASARVPLCAWPTPLLLPVPPLSQAHCMTVSGPGYGWGCACACDRHDMQGAQQQACPQAWSLPPCSPPRPALSPSSLLSAALAARGSPPGCLGGGLGCYPGGGMRSIAPPSALSVCYGLAR